MQVNLRSFKQKVKLNAKQLRSYLTKIEKKTPKKLDYTVANLSTEVWAEVDCLSCANCCKSMSPTFTTKDVKRIAAYLEMKPAEFKSTWLEYDKKDKDWVNVSKPCQFLNLSSNMCSIYEVRPADCAGFPHFTKKKFTEYIHVHKQNVEYCPATYKLVEKMSKIDIFNKK